MYEQVSFLVLGVLVAVSLCAPAPKVFRVGTFHRGSMSTGTNIGANGKSTHDGNVTTNTGYAKLGLSASGDIAGGAFVQNGDHVYEAAGEYHASGGGWVKPTYKGHVKKGADGKDAVGGGVKWNSDGELSGAGSAGIFTDKDALNSYNEVHERRADDILKGMDDDDEDYK